MAVAGISVTSVSAAVAQDLLHQPRPLQISDPHGVNTAEAASDPVGEPTDLVTLNAEQSNAQAAIATESEDPVLQAFFRLLQSTQPDSSTGMTRELSDGSSESSLSLTTTGNTLTPHAPAVATTEAYFRMPTFAWQDAAGSTILCYGGRAMPDVDLQGLAARYASMTETELMSEARVYDQLVESAQALLRAEFARRGLEPPLVEDDEDRQTAPDLNLVTVAQYRDLSEAIVARSVLQQAGIPCYLRDENTIRIDWGLSNMMGGMRLQVAERDLADAHAALSAPIPASFPIDSGPDYQQPICPRCGSINVSTDNMDQKIGLAGAMINGALLPIALPAMAMQPKNALKCNQCGLRWTDDTPEQSAEPVSPKP